LMSEGGSVIPPELREIDHDYLFNVVLKRQAVAIDRNIVPPSEMIWGGIGIGKSTTIKRFAEWWLEHLRNKGVELKGIARYKESENYGISEYLSLADIRLSQYMAVDFRGMPDKDLKKIRKGEKPTPITRWNIMELVAVEEDSYGIMFFDELNLGTEEAQKAALEIILDRRVGGVKIPDTWVIVAAGNTTWHTGGTSEFLVIQLMDRLGHYYLRPPTADEWIRYNMQYEIPHPIVTAFVKEHAGRGVMYDVDPNALYLRKSTPRSLSTLAKKLNMIEWAGIEQGSKEFERALIYEAQSTIGAHWADILKDFYNAIMKERIDLDAIWNDPRSARIPDQLGSLWYITTGMISRFNEAYEKNPKEAIKRILLYADRLAELGSGRYEKGKFVIRSTAHREVGTVVFQNVTPKILGGEEGTLFEGLAKLDSETRMLMAKVCNKYEWALPPDYKEILKEVEKEREEIITSKRRRRRVTV